MIDDAVYFVRGNNSSEIPPADYREYKNANYNLIFKLLPLKN